MNLDEMVCIAYDGEGRACYKRLGDLTKEEYLSMLALLRKQQVDLQAEMLLLETAGPSTPNLRGGAAMDIVVGMASVILFSIPVYQIGVSGFWAWQQTQSPLLLGLGFLLFGLYGRLSLLNGQLHQFVTLKKIMLDEADGSMRHDVYMKLKALFKCDALEQRRGEP
jgi:hypothetical protein